MSFIEGGVSPEFIFAILFPIPILYLIYIIIYILKKKILNHSRKVNVFVALGAYLIIFFLVFIGMQDSPKNKISSGKISFDEGPSDTTKAGSGQQTPVTSNGNTPVQQTPVTSNGNTPVQQTPVIKDGSSHIKGKEEVFSSILYPKMKINDGFMINGELIYFSLNDQSLNLNKYRKFKITRYINNEIGFNIVGDAYLIAEPTGKVKTVVEKRNCVALKAVYKRGFSKNIGDWLIYIWNEDENK